MSIFVDYAPNTAPALQEVWAFVSRDAAGQENVIAVSTVGLGTTALITGNAKTFERFKRMAAEAKPLLEAAGQTIHLLRFTVREEIGDWA